MPRSQGTGRPQARAGVRAGLACAVIIMRITFQFLSSVSPVSLAGGAILPGPRAGVRANPYWRRPRPGMPGEAAQCRPFFPPARPGRATDRRNRHAPRTTGAAWRSMTQWGAGATPTAGRPKGKTSLEPASSRHSVSGWNLPKAVSDISACRYGAPKQMGWMAPAPPASQCAIMQLSLMTANERSHPDASYHNRY